MRGASHSAIGAAAAAAAATASSSATSTMSGLTGRMARAGLASVPSSSVASSASCASSPRRAPPRLPLSSSSASRVHRRALHSSSAAYTSPSSAAAAQVAATPSPADAPPATAVEGEASAAGHAAGPAPKWTPSSRRVGLIAKKMGMTTYFLPTGERIPATVLRVTSNQISAHIGFSAPSTTLDGQSIPDRKIKARLAYTALQVAATDSLSRHGVTRQVRGHLEKAGIQRGKKIIKEFKVSRDAIVPLGTYLSAAHFVPGQQIDVRANSRGKGFQGVMKRHGFKGLRASHGVSISHRSHGSTGQNQDPGRVFPGKKMAGRMGGKQATVHNLEVLRIDTVRDLVIVQGPVPGPEGAHVLLSDAKKALVGKAANAWSKGILPHNKGLATGTEGADSYLPAGVADLPFPAGTRDMAHTLPPIVEVAAKDEAA